MPVAMDMVNCPDLAVPMEVMQHVVNVESARNPFAIGVVGARLVRQPANLPEAIATVHMLEDQGYNFSLGIAQVNRYNLAKYGLTSYERAFDICASIRAGARILSECHTLAGGDWGKSFSCYYSGNFLKGFEDGYVQKVFDSMRGTAPGELTQSRTAPIALAQAVPNTERAQHSKPTSMNASQYRAYMRSTTIDAVGSAPLSPGAQDLFPTAQVGVQPDVMRAPPGGGDASLPLETHASANGQSVFIPQTSGVNGNVQEKSPKPARDRADLRLGNRDDTFVF